MQLCETKLELSERESRGRPYNGMLCAVMQEQVQRHKRPCRQRRDVVVVNDDCRRKEARRDADVDAAKETVMDRVDQYARERLERGGYIWTC